MPRKTRIWKERRLYYYTCKGDGMRRSTLKRKVAKRAMCRKCIHNHVPDNQRGLFDDAIVGVGTVQRSNFDPATQVPNGTGREI